MLLLEQGSLFQAGIGDATTRPSASTSSSWASSLSPAWHRAFPPSCPTWSSSAHPSSTRVSLFTFFALLSLFSGSISRSTSLTITSTSRALPILYSSHTYTCIFYLVFYVRTYTTLLYQLLKLTFEYRSLLRYLL